MDATVGCLPYIWVREQRRRQSKACVALALPHKYEWGKDCGWKFSSSLPRHRAHRAQQEAVVYKQETDSLMLRVTILITWR